MKKILWITSVFTFSLFTSMNQGDENQEILLWPQGAPGSEGKSGDEQLRISEQGDQVISNVHKPSIRVYLPSSEINTGAAIIIIPGGGHSELWISHEGYSPAEWFQENGITAFVLKYRLAREENSTYTVDKDELADIQRAIRLVRSRAKEWDIDPSRVGVIGFSAGGELAALSAMRFGKGDQNAPDPIDRLNDRPDFQALIYPGNIRRLEVSKNSPPVFIAGGYNDYQSIAEGMAELYLKYLEAKVPAELHIYATAGHGFGIRESNTGAITQWPWQVKTWLTDIGIIPGTPANK